MSRFRSLALEHEGASLIGQVAIPAGEGPFPAVLVMASAYGLGDQVKANATKLADLGYVAVASDMYGGGAYFEESKRAGPALMALHQAPDLLRSRCVAWFEAAAALPQVDPRQIAAIGYCFGGQCVLELARSGADVKAAVSFHGLLTTSMPAERGTVKGEILAWCGALDPFAPPEQIDALRAELIAAGAKHQIMVFSDAAHSFTDPDAARVLVGPASPITKWRTGSPGPEPWPSSKRRCRFAYDQTSRRYHCY